MYLNDCPSLAGHITVGLERRQAADMEFIDAILVRLAIMHHQAVAVIVNCKRKCSRFKLGYEVTQSRRGWTYTESVVGATEPVFAWDIGAIEI